MSFIRISSNTYTTVTTIILHDISNFYTDYHSRNKNSADSDCNRVFLLGISVTSRSLQEKVRTANGTDSCSAHRGQNHFADDWVFTAHDDIHGDTLIKGQTGPHQDIVTTAVHSGQ